LKSVIFVIILPLGDWNVLLFKRYKKSAMLALNGEAVYGTAPGSYSLLDVGKYFYLGN